MPEKDSNSSELNVFHATMIATLTMYVDRYPPFTILLRWQQLFVPLLGTNINIVIRIYFCIIGPKTRRPSVSVFELCLFMLKTFRNKVNIYSLYGNKNRPNSEENGLFISWEGKSCWYVVHLLKKGGVYSSSIIIFTALLLSAITWHVSYIFVGRQNEAKLHRKGISEESCCPHIHSHTHKPPSFLHLSASTFEVISTFLEQTPLCHMRTFKTLGATTLSPNSSLFSRCIL